MKKLIALVLALAMCFALMTACGKKGPSLKQVKKSGKLVVATSPDFAPFESLENGEVVGIEVEIMKLICEKLGVELEIAQMDFESVLPGVQAGKYDCGMSGITITEDRQKNMLFTIPYYNAAQVIVVQDGSTIKGKADLAGKTVSVQTGTTAESTCQDEDIAFQAFNANADAKAALTTGKVDAWIVDNLTALQMVADGDGLVILDEKLTEEPYAFAFAFGSEDLVEEINKYLTAMIDDGTIEEIFTEFGEDYMKP